MSCIKDASAEIDDLKISISETVVIHAFNNLDSHFRPYLVILSHNAQENEKLPTFSELTKTLEDEEMRLSNQDRGIANFARGSKAKSKPNEQENKEVEEGSEKQKWQEKDKCHYCGKKHPGDCWHLKTKRFFCHNVGHIAAKCPEKSDSSNSAPFLSTPKSQSRNMTCVTKKISPESKTNVGRILASCLVTPRPNTTSITSVIIG